jgi:hypothetical protein
MSGATIVERSQEARGIEHDDGTWECPACGGIEPTEFVLRINHGFDSHDHAGYWWENHGACTRSYRTLMDAGWWPRGRGPREDMVEAGHVLTYREEREVSRAFERGGWWNRYQDDVDPSVVATQVAEVLRPILVEKMMGSVGYDLDAMVELGNKIQVKIEDRVRSNLEQLMTQYESQGVAFGTGESLNRAILGLMRIEGLEVPNGNEGGS